MKLNQLNSIDGSNEGREMVLIHPEQGKTDVKFWVLGKHSDLMRQRMAAFRKKAMKLLPQEAAELSEAEAMETRIQAITKWQGLEDDHGEPLELTADNLRNLFTIAPWVAEQVDRFITNEANFLPKLASD